jgi:probable phosphomutase (TIGR03848 family)
VTTVLLLRHGQSTANAEAILAGWMPGVELDDTGRDQAEAVAQRLQEVRISAICTSPLERCRQTAEAVKARHRRDLPLHTEVGLAECRYGDWTGQPLEILAKDPLWEKIQNHPSGVTFPEGESLAGMQARAIAAVRRWNRRLGPSATYVAVTHGDVIKSLLADALGMHLDLFQRIRVDPGSVSAIHYTEDRAYVARVNDVGGDLSVFSPPRSKSGDGPVHGVVGGETGP